VTKRLIALLLLLAPTATAEPGEGPFRKIAVIHLREESSEAIDPSVKASVLRRLEQIREWGADCIILDIESYGGLVTASIETGDEIFAIGREVHTIAYVGRKAISGAAMLSVACQEIVMSEAATIGDSQVIFLGPSGGPQVAPEKFQTTVAATFRKYADGNGYPVPVLEAMVRAEMEVLRYRRDDGGWEYYRSDTPDGLPSRREVEEKGLQEPPEVVVREDELPTFSAVEAMDYGICSRIEPNLDALIASIRAPDAEVRTFEWTWAERFSRFLLGIRFLLFLGGAGALYFALKTPGTGIPELLALVFFGLFFGASAIAGFAGTFELVLFIVGLGLIAAEIFVIPGFGVAGLLGLACLLGSIALAALPAGDWPATPGYFLLPVARDFLLGSFTALALVFLIARHLPSAPFFRRLELHPPAQQTGTASRETAGGHPQVGATGTASTLLRPAGTAEIEGRRTDVVTEGAFVPAGTRIKIVAVVGNRVIVRPEDGDPA